jgi:U2 small nuclear ribonucleoprotein A'
MNTSLSFATLYSLVHILILKKGRQYYRLYAINNLPSLKVLDFVKIKPAERDRAQRLANSAAGAALESDVQSDRAKTFEPGEGMGGKSFVAANFTAEQKDRIRELLAKASSVQEVEEIESAVRRGVLPGALQHLASR